MTTAWEDALAEVAKLPSDEQERLGALLLDELRSEQRWARTLEQSGSALKSLAEQALSEHRAGKTRPLDELL